MIQKIIKQQAKTKKVNVFFDMDGTLAEYDPQDSAKVKANQPNLFINLRPLKNNLKILKELSKIKNVKVYILSNCYFIGQEQEKILWLKKYCPFIEAENVKINVFEKGTYTKQQRTLLKINYLQELMQQTPNEQFYLIEDDVRIIKAGLQNLPKLNLVHVSMLIN